MNSFALLQDEVEDDGAAVSTTTPDAPANGVPNGTPASEPNGLSAPADPAAPKDPDAPDQQPGAPDSEPSRKERDLTLEEYFQQKAALSSGLAPLNSRSARKANDGGKSVDKMSVLKKPDETDVLDGVPVKTLHETKALKDSTHATVARNAEIQKFFQRDPNERRPYAGRGRGRGGYHNHHHHHNNNNNSSDDYRSNPRGGGGGYSRGGRGGYDRDRGNMTEGASQGDGGRRFDRPRSDRFDRDRPGFRGGYRGGYRGGFRGGDDRANADARAENGDVNAAPAPRPAPAAGDDQEAGPGDDAGNKQRFDRSASSPGDRFERAGSGGSGGAVANGGDRFERPDYHRGERFDSARGGRGRFDGRGRGRGRGRGAYHGDSYRPQSDRKFAPKSAVVAPNVDDTVAFPSL